MHSGSQGIRLRREGGRGCCDLWLWFLLLMLPSAAQAASLEIPITFTEPTMATLVGRRENDTLLKLTRIRWRQWACIDQPPPNVRVADYGTVTWCGFKLGLDVPASSPAGGQTQTVTLVIPDAYPGWPRIEVEIIPFTTTWNLAVPWGTMDGIEARTIELAPAGENLLPPIQLRIQ